MHELTRMAYLDALGVDSYVSRQQLPGAAPTRRLALLQVTPQPAPVADQSAAAQPRMPRLDEAPRPVPATPPAVPQTRNNAMPRGAVGRFSLAAITVGGYIWVEELVQVALAREQVQLVHAMARAVSRDAAAPNVQQFDWPLHNNHQLDQGEDAARAAVAGFLQRQIDQQSCRGLVLLGDGSPRRVALDLLGDITVVKTLDTLSLLADPQLKKQAWRDLQPIVRGS